ncbi:MAG: nucleotidyltransferase domain-containing protein [Bacteroidota bacterium]|nr:nucleotidyltransferase domain-containing protein [Bacteroidota bacterium]
MKKENNYIQQIKTSLSELNPYLILLFGSYAYGNPDQDSDIDLLVVTKDNFIPKNFEEKHKIYLQVSKKIRHIKMQIAVDLIVHTLPMYEKFIKQDSSFAHEITTHGKIIYESNSTTMA